MEIDVSTRDSQEENRYPATPDDIADEIQADYAWEQYEAENPPQNPHDYPLLKRSNFGRYIIDLAENKSNIS